MITAVSCPAPVNPPFGRVMFNSVTYNSLISYECNYGYMMVGETVRRCERNKIWTGLQPICRGNTIQSASPHPTKHQLPRNQLWISWNLAKWLAGGQPDNITRCCHIQVGKVKMDNVFIICCIQMSGGDDILRAIIPDNMPGGWKVESSYPQVLW